MSSEYYFDTHTLYVKCESATAEQIRRSITEALTTYQKTSNTNFDGRFRVNLVKDKNGTSFGIAFVFFMDSAFYYMLLGKNPDGSDRIEYRDDPSWSPPSETEDVNDAGWSTIATPVWTTGMSWADMADEEDEYNRQLETEKNKHICPKIPVTLEPLIVLPPYKLTPEQIEEKRQKIIEENEGKPNFDPTMVEVPEVAYLSVSPGLAKPVESKYMPNILKCKNVPTWITKDDLKVQFSPYASDRETVHERVIKGRRVEETYPFVNINDDRVAFVIFDPSTHDAYFALHMMKKTVISKRLPDGSENRITLLFGHSFRTDRDMMADIAQKPRPVQRRDNTPQFDRDGFQQRNNNRGRRNDRRDSTMREIQHAVPKSSARPWHKTGTNKPTAPVSVNKFALLSDE